MSTAGHAGGRSTDLCLTAEMMVQELGWDDDVDEDLRRRIEDILGDALVDDNFGERVDAVLLWWRSGDGDLADELITARTVLSGTGFVWLMTPKPARAEHVDAAEVTEAADLAGLHVTSRIDRRDWLGTRLTQSSPPAPRARSSSARQPVRW
ncbi:DUF3052 domain-containing protein [Rhodococcus opacus]|uniref:DUF3052 domain-containing protein n=1 Tax=Rhodococcus opacus TaxID=37919 RepID=A0A2S8J1E1_RHOOP|nr:DUF3052 domain-containing protein [Rhodococcus opacus]PQP20876.1 DUF3052 domain-containing protein [Rhodococcus opacus]